MRLNFFSPCRTFSVSSLPVTASINLWYACHLDLTDRYDHGLVNPSMNMGLSFQFSVYPLTIVFFLNIYSCLFMDSSMFDSTAGLLLLSLFGFANNLF